MRFRSPATVLLRRAQLTLVLGALIPTALMAVLGIVLLATRKSHAVALVAGILVIVFCVTALVGYILGSMFVSRGASIAHVQNEFLSAVSHELRTPLTSIRLFIDTLREGRVDDEAEKRRCLNILHQEIGRLDTLVGKLIQLSKIESREGAFTEEVVNIDDLVKQSLTAFRALDLGGEVDLQVNVAPGLTVRGDRDALAQAMVNLLANAHKYTRPEGKRIEVTATADARRVHLAVADNGYGLAPHETKSIFQKFERGSAASQAGSSGTGLGLSIVQAIVESHKGVISVDSVQGRGATFRISLPRA